MKENVRTTISIRLPQEFLDEIDTYAESMCLTRTSAIISLCKTTLMQQAAMNDLNRLMSLMGGQTTIPASMTEKQLLGQNMTLDEVFQEAKPRQKKNGKKGA